MIVFVLLRVVPGDPIAMLIGPGATEADIAELRRLYGLDESIAVQFVYYLRDLAGGDFGTSISMRQDVMELVLGRLPVTIELCLVAMLVAVGLGGAMALAGAYWRGRAGEAAVDGAAGFILAIPDFLWALLFILFVVVFALDGLPISGRIGHDVAFRGATGFLLIESLLRLRLDAFGSVLLHTVLPAARPCAAAGRDYRAGAQDLDKRGDDPGLHPDGAGQGLLPGAHRRARGAPQRAGADGDADRRPVHLPCRRHGAGREDLSPIRASATWRSTR